LDKSLFQQMEIVHGTILLQTAKEWLRKDIEDEFYEMLINQGYEPIFINHIQVFGYNADECNYDESYKYIANFDNIYILTEKEAKRYKGSIIQG